MKHLRLFPIPLVLCLSWILIFQTRAPYAEGYHSDPAYAYLLNALNLLNGFRPGHIDHPGTPVQVFGAWVIFIQHRISCWFGSPCEAVTFSVLRNPEAYLRGINVGLVGALLLIFQVLSIRIANLAGSATALVFQGSLLIFFQIPLAMAGVSPEPMLIIATLISLYSLAPLIFSPDRGVDRALALRLGGALGFGLATKLVFIPIFISVLLLRRAKFAIWSLLAASLSFFLFTFPIRSSYGRFCRWAVDLAVRRGTYGSGEKGLPPIENLIENGIYIFRNEPFLGFAIFSGLAAIFLQRRRELKTPFLFIGLAIVISQIAITTKSPSLHYLLPSLVVSAMLVAVAYRSIGMTARKGATIGIGGLLAVGIFLSGAKWVKWRDEERAAVADLRATLDYADASGCVLVSYYRSSILAYALSFGNGYAEGRYSKELAELHPKSIFYNVWDESFSSFAGPIPREEFRRRAAEKCHLFYGSPLVPSFRPYMSKFTLETVSESEKSGLYRITGVWTSALNSVKKEVDAETAK